MSDKIGRLHEALALAGDARNMATSPVWDETWKKLEAELLGRLLKCGPTDDEARYRLSIAIETARNLRQVIENVGRTTQALEAELDVLEGRKGRPIA